MTLWRILLRVFGRQPDVPRDPAVQAAARDAREKAKQTHQLLDELRSRRNTLPRLERARLRYDERLHGTRQHL